MESPLLVQRYAIPNLFFCSLRQNPDCNAKKVPLFFENLGYQIFYFSLNTSSIRAIKFSINSFHFVPNHFFEQLSILLLASEI